MTDTAHALKRRAGTFFLVSLPAILVIALSWVGNAAAQTCGFCSAGDNTVSGQNAYTSNSSGIVNSAFGDGALEMNTSGSSNTSLGANSLLANTTGSSNTATGLDVLDRSTT